jgi:hypothetical protein
MLFAGLSLVSDVGAVSRFGVVSAARVGCVGCAGSALLAAFSGSRSML